MTFARPIIKTPNWFARRFLGINNNPYQSTIPGFDIAYRTAKKRDFYKPITTKVNASKTWLKNRVSAFKAKRDLVRRQKFRNNLAANLKIIENNAPPLAMQKPQVESYRRNYKYKDKNRSINQTPYNPFTESGRKLNRAYNFNRYSDLAEFSSPFYTRRITLGMIE